MRCVEEGPANRPDMDTLYTDVYGGMDAFDKNDGGMLGKRKAELPKWWRVEWKEEAFDIGKKT
jgi:hypothetical protein